MQLGTKVRKISEKVLRFIVEYNSNQPISYTKGCKGKTPTRQTKKDPSPVVWTWKRILIK
jgi:hypothetical protein